MNINAESPTIKYSEKGKDFAYDRMFYATLDKYIREYKNVRLGDLTEKDASICLARIIRKMEVNDVPVQQFFKDDLESWNDLSNHQRVHNMCDLIAKDIFCCFDKNRYDADGNFAKVDRIYCVNNDGVRDYITCNATVRVGLFKKEPTPEALYFQDLMERNKRGELPKSK